MKVKKSNKEIFNACPRTFCLLNQRPHTVEGVCDQNWVLYYKELRDLVLAARNALYVQGVQTAGPGGLFSRKQIHYIVWPIWPYLV